MTHNKFDDNYIKKLLQDMPPIEDQVDKDQLFDNISSELKGRTKYKKSKRKSWILPSFAFAIVIILAVITIQSSLTEMNNDLAESNKATDDMDTFESAEESAEESAGLPPQDQDVEFSQQQGETIAEDNVEKLESLTSHVIGAKKDQEIIIHAVALNSTVNHIIPISLIDIYDEQTELEQYHNQINSYIDERNWGVVEYPFDGITFNLDQNKQEVSLRISDDYQFDGGGGTIQGLFEGVISTMFRPYGYHTAVLEYMGNNQQLGMLGEIKSFPIESSGSQLYKMYQDPEADQQFLLPINTDRDLRWALDAMKEDQSESNIYATVPEDVHLEVQPNGNQLIIGLSADVSLGNNQETLTMIEAILMTAKSYNFTTVKFELAIEQIGPYHLNEEVPVPSAVNPVRLY